MAEVSYRNGAVADIPAILALWRHFWQPQAYETNLRHKLETEPDLIYVAECDDKIVGTVIGGFDGWWAWIYRVAVHPDFQRHLVGTHLVREMHRRLKARGADCICAVVSPKNESVLALLRRVGYDERGYQIYAYQCGEIPE
jgi:ribosomal protein S18 acetylase RimI-like enzyme